MLLLAGCASKPINDDPTQLDVQLTPGEEPSRRIGYLVVQGKLDEGLRLYREAYQDEHNLDSVRQIALQFLEKSLETGSNEAKLLTLYGSAMAAREDSIYFLARGLATGIPPFQLVAIQLLGAMNDDRADELIESVLGSPFLPLRFEAAYTLASKRAKTASLQIESLMAKVDPTLRPLFPMLFAMDGSAHSINVLKRLLHDEQLPTRLSAIHAVAVSGRDDLLPYLRKIASHLNPSEQEACAHAFALFRDHKSLARLRELASSDVPTVALAAHVALFQLGDIDAEHARENIKEIGTVFAPHLLANIPGSADLIYHQRGRENRDMRINSTLALLAARDPRCVDGLREVLIRDTRDFAFTRLYSLSPALTAWRVIPSAYQQSKRSPYLYEASLAFRESVLRECLELPEHAFLYIAEKILEGEQTDLIPTAVRLLENLQSDDAIQLLKQYSQKLGAPLVRTYCTLALYRLQEEGPWASDLKQWVEVHHKTQLIQLRPVIPWEAGRNSSQYALTPEETSRLLVESLEALIDQRDPQAISILLNALESGHETSRPVFAGLLLRASR